MTIHSASPSELLRLTYARLASALSLLTCVGLAACSASGAGDGASGGKLGAGGSANAAGSSSGGASSGSGGANSAGSSGGATGAGGNFASGGNTSGGANAGAPTAGAANGGSNTAGGNSGGPSGGTTGNGQGGSARGGAPSGGAGAAGAPSGGGNSAGAAGALGNSAENPGASCMVSAGSSKKNNKLPDPFAMHDGTRISTKADWECRRNEIAKDVEKYEIGPKQAAPKVEATYSGGKLNVKVTTNAGSITLSSTVAVGSGSQCVVIGMNGNSSMVSGCVQVPFMHDQVVKYAQDSTQVQSDPFYKVYPELWGKIGNYSAWSWGISRLIDGLEQLKDQLKIDPTKVAVHGCSYAGKMALFGGAFDARVALTVAQESGGGGINSWRTSQDFTTRTKTNIEKIDNTNYAWFMSSMKSLDPYSLPHDHHELIAMIAPRALIALGNADYDWLGDESGYRSIMAAKEVWKAMGVEDRIGFDFTSGHMHCQAASSQNSSVNAFVNKFLKGQSANTNIAIKPTKSGFDLTYTSVIDWSTPTLQ
jgi:hypothetical protein